MKKNILKILLFISFFVFSINFVSAGKYYTEKQIDIIYTNFISKLDLKYTKQKELAFLESLENKIEYIQKNKKLSPNLTMVINRLSFLNKNKINKIKKILTNNIYKTKFENKIIVDNSLYTKFDDIYKVNLTNQKNIEKSIVEKMLNNKNNFIVASYIKKLMSYNKKFFYLNEKNEYVIDWWIKKINFTSYYKLNSWNYDQFKNKSWIVIYSKNLWYGFVENYNIENKIPYSLWNTVLKWFFSDNKKFLLWNDWYYYSYNFNSFSSINDNYWFYLSTLKRLWFNKNTLLYIDKNNKFNFVLNYKKNKLINKDFLNDIWNKWLFLNILSDDYRYLNKNYLVDLINIKHLTKKITKGLNDKEKIKVIYWWILKNIDYTSWYTLTDYRIFSWLETYKNKNWVCSGYVKLMTYMLLFSWINNVEDIWWYVIDAPDFPNIWHAWLRIGDRYYDPTFDDPIWLSKTKNIEEYKYFGLPRDLFYANRYDYKDIPDNIKNASLDTRKHIIFNNLYKLAPKYINSWYLLLKPFIFRIKHWIWPKYKLTINDFKKYLNYYVVDDYKFYNKKWELKRITNISYYPVNDENIEKDIDNIFNYNLNWLYLFKWKLWNGNYEYRLTNNLTIK